MNPLIVPSQQPPSFFEGVFPHPLQQSASFPMSTQASISGSLPLAASRPMPKDARASQLEAVARIDSSTLQNTIRQSSNTASFATALNDHSAIPFEKISNSTNNLLEIKNNFSGELSTKPVDGVLTEQSRKDEPVAKHHTPYQSHQQPNQGGLQNHLHLRQLGSASTQKSDPLSNFIKPPGSSGLSQFQQGFNFAQQGALSAAAAAAATSANATSLTQLRSRKSVEKKNANGSPTSEQKWGPSHVNNPSPRQTRASKKLHNGSIPYPMNDFSAGLSSEVSPNHVGTEIVNPKKAVGFNNPQGINNLGLSNHSIVTERSLSNSNIAVNGGEVAKPADTEIVQNTSSSLGLSGVAKQTAGPEVPVGTSEVHANGTDTGHHVPSTTAEAAMRDKHRVERMRRDMDIYRQKKSRLEKAPSNDHERVLKVDFKTAFKSPIDAWQRLMPYHILMVPADDDELCKAWEVQSSKLGAHYHQTLGSLKKKWIKSLDFSFDNVIQGGGVPEKDENVLNVDIPEDDSEHKRGDKRTPEDAWVLTNEEAYDVEKVLFEDCVATMRQDAEIARKKAMEEAAKLAAQEAEKKRIQDAEAARANEVRMREMQRVAAMGGMYNQNVARLDGGAFDNRYGAEVVGISGEKNDLPNSRLNPSLPTISSVNLPAQSVYNTQSSSLLPTIVPPQAVQGGQSINHIGNPATQLQADQTSKASRGFSQESFPLPQQSTMHLIGASPGLRQQLPVQPGLNQQQLPTQHMQQTSNLQSPMHLSHIQQRSSPLQMMHARFYSPHTQQTAYPPEVPHSQIPGQSQRQGQSAQNLPVGQGPTVSAEHTIFSPTRPPASSLAESQPPPHLNISTHSRGHPITQDGLQSSSQPTNHTEESERVRFVNSSVNSYGVFGQVEGMMMGTREDWKIPQYHPSGPSGNPWNVSGSSPEDTFAQKLNRAPSYGESGRVGMDDLLNGDGNR